MLNEINFIHPKLLILMGRLSYETFFKSVLNKKPTVTLSNYIDHIVEIEKFSLEDGLNVYILPIQHASGANPSFNKMLKNRPLIKAIKKVLN